MRASLNTIEKLKLYYVELDSLESQLRSELIVESQSKYRGGLKKSRATKYKITVYRRAIAQMERIVNARAEIYGNWLSIKQDIERELEILEDEKLELVTVCNTLQAEVSVGEGLNLQSLTEKAMEYSKFSLELQTNKKRIADLKTELQRHLKKSPPQAGVVNRETIFNDMSTESTHHVIPEALGAIMREAQSRTITAEDLNLKVETDVSCFFTPSEYEPSLDQIPESQLVKGDLNANAESALSSANENKDNTVESGIKDTNLHSS